ncbi:30S ribosomal protein S16 [Clostridia bacterium]|nr:30S ribosomal protein S16 [Clostridia bacterium]
MVKIRLKRIGMKKHPFYRVVVTDGRNPRDGRFIEEIGYYDPMQQPAVVKIDADKATDWIKNGAQPTEVARILLKKVGVVAGKSAQPKPVVKAAEA